MTSWAKPSSTSNAWSGHRSKRSSTGSPTSSRSTSGSPTRAASAAVRARPRDGPVGAGTTYEDSTLFGKAPGEVETFEQPTRLVYHWAQKAPWGSMLAEGWPGYTLEAVGPQETLVRHDARLRTYGIYGPATPVMKRIALRERTAVLDALEASFA